MSTLQELISNESLQSQARIMKKVKKLRQEVILTQLLNEYQKRQLEPVDKKSKIT